MRRLALSLSVVAGLALLNACSNGSAGTGFSNTSSTNLSPDLIQFVNAANGNQGNVFIISNIVNPVPTPTPTPIGQTPSPTPTATAVPTPTPTPNRPYPPITPAPTPPYATPSPAPAPVSYLSQPLEITGIGYKNGGGVLGAIQLPTTIFKWGAAYAAAGTPVQNRTNGNVTVCGPPPAATPVIQIDVPFAATQSNPTPSNGDTFDPLHPSFVRAALDSNNTTVNQYKTIALFAPAPTLQTPYCINLVATAPNGTPGSVVVIVTPGS